MQQFREWRPVLLTGIHGLIQTSMRHQIDNPRVELTREDAPRSQRNQPLQHEGKCYNGAQQDRPHNRPTSKKSINDAFTCDNFVHVL